VAEEERAKSVPISKTVLKTAEEWGKQLGKRPHYVAGAAAYAGWKKDQLISQSEFEKKLAAWLNRPIGAKGMGV
jgi:hypothetical protein